MALVSAARWVNHGGTKTVAFTQDSKLNIMDTNSQLQFVNSWLIGLNWQFSAEEKEIIENWNT